MPDVSVTLVAPRCVFVYGTLRRGGRNDINRLQPAPRYLGTAQVQGVLYHLGRYPGMALTGSAALNAAPVLGEVYAIEPALEVVLDEIEGLGANPIDEYAKRELLVSLSGSAQGGQPPLLCLVYEINPRYVRTAPRIADGDWLRAAAQCAVA